MVLATQARRSTFPEAAIPALQQEQRARGGIPAAPSLGGGVESKQNGAENGGPGEGP